MSRPRIRTLKPDNWEDERVGRVSLEARLFRDVLITFADDEGRWRHLPARISGFGYPYDDIEPARIDGWTDELTTAGLIHVYEVDGADYGCFPKWAKHQRINRPTGSELPAPADIPPTSPPAHGALTEDSLADRKGRDKDGKGRRRLTSSSLRSSKTTTKKGRGNGKVEDPEASRLASLFADLIRERDPKAKPGGAMWVRDMRLLIKDREGDVAEVEQVMRWGQEDIFWQTNCLSPSKLRKQFGQIRAKMIAAGIPVGPRESLADYAARMNRQQGLGS